MRETDRRIAENVLNIVREVKDTSTNAATSFDRHVGTKDN